MIAVTQGTALGGVAALAMAAAFGWVKVRRRRRLLALARAITLRYARLLSVKQKQLVIHDGYGNYELKPWIAHVDYFIETVILRDAQTAGLKTAGLEPGTATWTALRRELLAVVNAESDAGVRSIAEDDVVSGEHYETLCRNVLRAQGWHVAFTPMTGDQGADLIAEAGGRRVVIQCKFHARPVGNKAVQEAAAALAFHAGDQAAVVSNAGFTRSAEHLARANDILLLHHDQLVDLGRLMRVPTAGAG